MNSPRIFPLALLASLALHGGVVLPSIAYWLQASTASRQNLRLLQQMRPIQVELVASSPESAPKNIRRTPAKPRATTNFSASTLKPYSQVHSRKTKRHALLHAFPKTMASPPSLPSQTSQRSTKLSRLLKQSSRPSSPLRALPLRVPAPRVPPLRVPSSIQIRRSPQDSTSWRNSTVSALRKNDQQADSNRAAAGNSDRPSTNTTMRTSALPDDTMQFRSVPSGAIASNTATSDNRGSGNPVPTPASTFNGARQATQQNAEREAREKQQRENGERENGERESREREKQQRENRERQEREKAESEARAKLAARPTEPPAPQPRGPTRDAEILSDPRPDISEAWLDEVSRRSVTVRFQISVSGSASAQVIRSSGSARVDERVLSACRRWRFRPALRDGEPRASSLRLRVEF